MRILSLLFGLLLPITALAAPSASKPIALERAVSGRIVIAPDGHVQDFTLDPSGSQQIDTALDKAIRGWTFEPVVVDGRVVTAETRMQVGLSLVPIEAGYQLRIERVAFGAARRQSDMQPPRYPREAMMIGLGAKVILALQLNADGTVAQVHVEQASLDKRTPTDAIAERWRRVFEKASIAAAKQWRFDDLERIDGKPVAGSVRIPVEYVVGDVKPTQWRAFVPGPYHPVPWVQQLAVAQEQLDALHEGQAQGLESRVRLRDQVVGRLL